MEQNPNGCAFVFTFKSNIRMGGILSGNMLKLNSNIVSWVGVKMELRIATPKDIAVIQQLRIKMLGEVAGDLPGNLPQAIFEYLNTHLQDGSCLCALIGADRNVVGKAMLCIYEVMPDEVNTTGQCASLFSVYTLPQFRGHGYMERLLRFLLEKAKGLGVKEALACAEIKAIPLYKRIGFKLKEQEIYIRL